MALLHTQAIILKSQRWGEADRIVTFYTLRFGKIRGIARGARKMKTRFGGALEPFSHVNLIVFEKGNDSLCQISQVDLSEGFWRLRTNLEHMGAAAGMVNLIAGLVADRDPGCRLFHLLLNALRAIVQTDDPFLIALIFQILVLGQTGFRPQTDQCASCGKRYQSDAVRFSPLAGGLICSACERVSLGQSLPMSPGSLAFIQQVRRLDFPSVTRLKASGQVRKEVETAIETYVHVILEKSGVISRRWVAESVEPYRVKG